LVLVEFQPSGWSRGAYLNVGAKWLWHPDSVWSFDYSLHPGARVGTFREFIDEDQFDMEARQLAEVAARETKRLKDNFGTVAALVDRLEERADRGGWDLYHAGAAAFLAGRAARAREHFVRLSRPDPSDERSGGWVRDLRAVAADLADACAQRPDSMRERLTKMVCDSREALRLTAWTGALPRAPHDAI
jgi:hypothetical protein